MSSAATLTVEDLVAGYLVEPVLHGVNLTARPGEVLAVLGPNGAGKTTLLKTIVGLLRPSSGHVRLGDRVIDGLPVEKRGREGVILVPEGRRLFGSMTAEENLRTGRFTGRTGTSFEDVYRLFPRLKERTAQRASSLSGGEQQMLVIGRALLTDPKVLLIDEPSLGLAPQLVEAVFGVFGDLATQGRAILVAEQNVAVATRVAHRCLLIAGGQIVFEGPSETDEQRQEVRRAYGEMLQIEDGAP